MSFPSWHNIVNMRTFVACLRSHMSTFRLSVRPCVRPSIRLARSLSLSHSLSVSLYSQEWCQQDYPITYSKIAEAKEGSFTSVLHMLPIAMTTTGTKIVSMNLCLSFKTLGMQASELGRLALLSGSPLSAPPSFAFSLLCSAMLRQSSVVLPAP